MRPIKFRAWDIDSSSMWQCQERSSMQDFYIDFAGDEMFLMMPVEDDYPDKRDAILMQFTGLLDKNGKEIYEGDILKTDNYNGIHYFVIEYENDWNGALGCFRGRCIDGEFSSVHCNLTEIGEVIGNIYENPELLTQ